MIVLGGGLSKCAALYELVPARWGEHVFCDLDVLATRLLPRASATAPASAERLV